MRGPEFVDDAEIGVGEILGRAVLVGRPGRGPTENTDLDEELPAELLLDLLEVVGVKADPGSL